MTQVKESVCKKLLLPNKTISTMLVWRLILKFGGGGKTYYEAIGNLVNAHAERFCVEVVCEHE